MTIVSCPKCADSVTLPSGASPEAEVQCPLCKDTFELSEVLAALPPALIVLSDPAAEELRLAPTDEPVIIAPSSNSTDAPAFGINASVATAAKPAAGAARKRRPAAPPQRRKPKNPAMEVMKIVLGGVAGLVIAQLLLWWMPKDAWRRDPFGLGPKVSAAAPWLVPQQFHGQNEASNDGAEPDATGTPSGDETGLPAGGVGGVSESGLPIRSFVDPNQNGPGAVGKGGSTKKSGAKSNGDRTSAAEPSAPAEDPFAVPHVSEPVLELPSIPGGADDAAADPFGIGSIPTPEPVTPVPATPDALHLPDVDLVLPDDGDDPLSDITLDSTLFMGLEPALAEPAIAESERPTGLPISGAPKVTAAELQDAIKAASAQADAWNGASEQDFVKMAGPCFTALVELGRAAAYTESAAPQDAEQVLGALRAVSNDPAKVELFQRAGARWLTKSDRTSDGVIVVGTVKAVRKHDDLQEMVLEIAADDTVSVFSRATAPDEQPTGMKLLVLGAIVQDPADQLAGYPGDAPFVIWKAAAVPAATQ